MAAAGDEQGNNIIKVMLANVRCALNAQAAGLQRENGSTQLRMSTRANKVGGRENFGKYVRENFGKRLRGNP